MQEIYMSAQQVRKTYDGVVALENATLNLYRGEILALLGSNGAGKTTFIKILATLLTKDSGHVEVLGYNLDNHEKEIRHFFGYVGQDTERSAYARLTVIENLRFFGALQGLNKKQINQQIDKLVSYFDFETNLNKLFMQLSGGQKQAVVIIRALLHDPVLIYLDEPTKGLDPIVAQKIRSFLKQYVLQENKSLLLTSHILSEVDHLADRAALIHKGKIEVIDSPENLKSMIGVTEFIEMRKEFLPTPTKEKILQHESVSFCSDNDLQWISFGVTDIFSGTEAVIQALREDNVHLTFRQRSVSLEDAYLHIIGTLSDKFE